MQSRDQLQRLPDTLLRAPQSVAERASSVFVNFRTRRDDLETKIEGKRATITGQQGKPFKAVVGSLFFKPKTK
ncbi:Hypp5704 [Branchiostoma lanceolatum]|uniref:Hypp5704 protein n=1 Tax=Branchiostoma lanceolatum TaxID=7740 RepID=A0A8J9VFT6_BRALA|nr:Hypp5704 [Branchiostoma lanceolatum]